MLAFRVALATAPILAAALVLSLLAGHGHARRPPRAGRGACAELAAGPSRLYACADGRAYLVTRGIWRDVGPRSPVPPVPKGD